MMVFVPKGSAFTDAQIEEYLREEWKHKDWSYTGGNNAPRCDCGALLNRESPEASLDRHRVRASAIAALKESPTAESDAQEAVTRLKDSGIGSYAVLAAVTKVYDLEMKS